uniref:Uncharacterized protein LOC113785811 n=1 Tax=Cicer arietinum TaxID=3827 RepID=A0A3Q7YDX2_CICAR|nr:uncharacterized protein LOC113785811 [Cicer arietinum]
MASSIVRHIVNRRFSFRFIWLLSYWNTFFMVQVGLALFFAVGLWARFQSSPKESHLIAVKRIFRYLVGTTDLDLWYSKGSHFDFVAYCDVDYAGDKIERKSTSGACQFLGEALISWSCRKQNTIALSTTEVEYVATTNCCSQVLWNKNQLEVFSVRY